MYAHTCYYGCQNGPFLGQLRKKGYNYKPAQLPPVHECRDACTLE
jgi:hypothetical protein